MSDVLALDSRGLYLHEELKYTNTKEKNVREIKVHEMEFGIHVQAASVGFEELQSGAIICD